MNDSHSKICKSTFYTDDNQPSGTYQLRPDPRKGMIAQHRAHTKPPKHLRSNTPTSKNPKKNRNPETVKAETQKKTKSFEKNATSTHAYNTPGCASRNTLAPFLSAVFFGLFIYTGAGARMSALFRDRPLCDILVLAKNGASFEKWDGFTVFRLLSALLRCRNERAMMQLYFARFNDAQQCFEDHVLRVYFVSRSICPRFYL